MDQKEAQEIGDIIFATQQELSLGRSDITKGRREKNKEIGTW